MCVAELVVNVAIRCASHSAAVAAAAADDGCRSATGQDNASTPRHGTGSHSGRQSPCGAGCWSKRLLRRNPDGWTGLCPDHVLAFRVDVLDGVTLHNGWNRNGKSEQTV